jgi:hypothetical protein
VDESSGTIAEQQRAQILWMTAPWGKRNSARVKPFGSLHRLIQKVESKAKSGH